MTSNKDIFEHDHQNQNHKNNHNIHDENSELEFYGEEGITSLDAPVPLWLKCNYVFWIIVGITWFFMFWNGSTVSFFDRGYWHELQEAANTTFPYSETVEGESKLVN